MKRIQFVVLMVVVFLLVGCAGYGNLEQYRKGDWYFISGPNQVAETMRDRLALEKLAAEPVLAKKRDGIIQGYKVILANLDDYDRYTLRISGPEKKSYMLNPGEQIEVYLIPGEYECRVVRRGKISASNIMTVDAEKKRFGGVWCHGFCYCGD